MKQPEEPGRCGTVDIEVLRTDGIIMMEGEKDSWYEDIIGLAESSELFGATTQCSSSEGAVAIHFADETSLAFFLGKISIRLLEIGYAVTVNLSKEGNSE